MHSTEGVEMVLNHIGKQFDALLKVWGMFEDSEGTDDIGGALTSIGEDLRGAIVIGVRVLDGGGFRVQWR